MATLTLSAREVGDDDLPNVCMCCGSPATTSKRKTFSWHPEWIAVTILLGLLVYVILAIVLTKKMVVRVTFCDQHSNHFSKRTLMTWLSFLGLGCIGIVGFILFDARGAQQGDNFGFFCFGMLILLILWLVVVVVLQNSAIKPTKITNDSITLRNISDEFVNAVREMRVEEQEDEYDDYEDRPQKRRMGYAEDEYDDEPRTRRRRDDDDRDDDDRNRRRRFDG